MPDINVAQVIIVFVILVFSLTVHEMAHAWTADRLGDPTARLLGRVSLNPLVHADLIGTVVFPLMALVSGVPLIGWAKPVPVNIRLLRHQRRDYVLVAAAGPASPVNVRLLRHDRRDYVLVAAAGPASNLVLAVGTAVLLAAFPVSAVLGGPNMSGLVDTSLRLAVRLSCVVYEAGGMFRRKANIGAITFTRASRATITPRYAKCSIDVIAKWWQAKGPCPT